MKRVLGITAIVFFFLNLSSVYAQLSLDTGLKVGANLSQIDATNLDETTSTQQLQGYMGGIFVRLTLLGTFAIQPEINYMQKGGVFVEESGFRTTTLLNYVEVPVLGKINLFNLLGVIKTSVYGGVAFSKLIEAKTQFEVDDQVVEQDVRELYNERDKSYVGGVDLQLDLKAINIILDGRVTLSQDNILVPEMQSVAKNRVYTLSIGFVF